MNQILRLSGGQPAMKFNLSDVISTCVGQLGNCLFLTLIWLLYICIFFSDFMCFDMSLLLLIVTLWGVSNKHCLLPLFLAHLSRRLKGELIVYEGIRRPSVVCQHFQTTSPLKP